VSGWKWAGDSQVLVFIIAVLAGLLLLVLEFKFGSLAESSVGWSAWA
jgi:hypothetical protein